MYEWEAESENMITNEVNLLVFGRNRSTMHAESAASSSAHPYKMYIYKKNRNGI